MVHEKACKRKQISVTSKKKNNVKETHVANNKDLFLENEKKSNVKEKHVANNKNLFLENAKKKYRRNMMLIIKTYF